MKFKLLYKYTHIYTGSVECPSLGEHIHAHIKQVVPNQALLVYTAHGPGRVDITDITDHYGDDPLESFKGDSSIFRSVDDYSHSLKLH